MSLLWCSKNFQARSGVVLICKAWKRENLGDKAGKFLLSPWAWMRRQNNFSFTNAHFSSEEVWPKGHADDIQFYISASGTLMNVFEHLRKALIEELDENEVAQRQLIISGSIKRTWKKQSCFMLSQLQSAVLLVLRIQFLILGATDFSEY